MPSVSIVMRACFCRPARRCGLPESAEKAAVLKHSAIAKAKGRGIGSSLFVSGTLALRWSRANPVHMGCAVLERAMDGRLPPPEKARNDATPAPCLASTAKKKPPEGGFD